MATRFAFVDDSGETRLAGFLVPEPGGSVPFPTQAGSGSPVGAVVPTGIGALYVDTDGGGIYIAVGATNADWVQLGGATHFNAPGVYSPPGGNASLNAPANTKAIMTDMAANEGSGNGVFWNAGGDNDGEQVYKVVTGVDGAHELEYNAAGVLTSDGEPIGGSGALLTASLALSSADILSLNSTPVQIVAAPGAGKIINPVAFLAKLTFATTPYDFDDYFSIDYDGNANDDNPPLGAGNNGVDDFLRSSESVIGLADHESAWAIPIANAVNRAMVVRATNGDPVGGDSTVYVELQYTVVTLP